MKKILFSVLCFIVALQTGMAQITIAAARASAIGATVTIKGICTNGAELGPIRYLQDASGAGLPAYSATQLNNVRRGDSVLVTGVLKNFNNLLELDPLTSVTIINSNNPLPAPVVINTLADLNETTEGELVVINGVSFPLGATVFAGNTNYTMSNGAQTRVGNTVTSLVSKPIPTASVNVVGVLSQYCITPANGCMNGYQILIRDSADIVQLANYYITGLPTQTNTTTTSFRLNWQTNRSGSTILRYGITPNLGSEQNFNLSDSNHVATLTGLSPATVYYVQCLSIRGTDTAISTVQPYITNATSSGEMRVFFNKPNASSFAAPGNYPQGITGASSLAAMIERINAATQTIDLAMYNSDNVDIANAMIAAAARGVRVRVIVDKAAVNDAFFGRTFGFQVIKSANLGQQTGLMHNKFFIIDAGNASRAWVTSGAMNITQGQINDDPNNLILIQDQALARVFTLEFEEMWGSTTATANIALGKFGAFKTDNTPHQLSIGGKAVECYFSPTDRTTDAINKNIASANVDLEMALLVFTQNSIGTAVAAAKARNVNIRVIMNDTVSSSGSEAAFLISRNISAQKWTKGNIFHHKYAVIDGTPAGANSDPILMTGSHNYSAAAETVNDENYLVIHDGRIANLFLQEFEGRWCDNNDLPCRLTLNSEEAKGIEGLNVKAFPNPTSGVINLDLSSAKAMDVTVTLRNSIGQAIQSFLMNAIEGNTQRTLLTDGLPNGQYFIVIQADNKTSVLPVQIAK
jgi:phosphatidylserine/phosphatidylglycerophosphate/cardiolipin synthase-like enzyme